MGVGVLDARVLAAREVEPRPVAPRPVDFRVDDDFDDDRRDELRAVAMPTRYARARTLPRIDGRVLAQPQALLLQPDRGVAR
jgi:hypothetical protein